MSKCIYRVVVFLTLLVVVSCSERGKIKDRPESTVKAAIVKSEVKEKKAILRNECEFDVYVYETYVERINNQDVEVVDFEPMLEWSQHGSLNYAVKSKGVFSLRSVDIISEHAVIQKFPVGLGALKQGYLKVLGAEAVNNFLSTSELSEGFFLRFSFMNTQNTKIFCNKDFKIEAD